MKATWMFVFAVLLVLGGGAVSAVADTAGAGDPFVFSFDENGNGYFSVNGGPVFFSKGIVAPDPTGGVAGNVLYFNLPELVGTGDVRVIEPGATSTTLSDMLRFVNLANGNYGQGGFTLTANAMIFYSGFDVPPVPGEPGFDSGLPGNVLLNDGGNPPAEGADGNFIWLPGGNVYNGFSDGTIPEPSSLVLLGTVGAAIWIIRRRRLLVGRL